MGTKRLIEQWQYVRTADIVGKYKHMVSSSGTGTSWRTWRGGDEERMSLDNINFPEIPDIALGKVIPDSVRIRQMEEEEKYKTLKSIAENAGKQADIASKQVKILEEQLSLYKAQIDGAKKDAKISKALAILSIITAAIFAILPLL